MSKLPPIQSTYTEGQSMTTNDSFKQNGANGSELVLPSLSKTTRTPPQYQKQGINAVVLETKFNELQSKLSVLEEANSILLSRLNNTERNFSMQIQELQLLRNEDKDDKAKSQKILSILHDQTNLANSDLNMKINMIQEVIEKEEKWKAQQRERDIEMYKNLINKLTEKVSETVKMEVDARFKADLDNKYYAQMITGKFENEIDIVRKTIDDVIAQTRNDLATISKECSERTHKVSKYIDQQISEAVFGKGGNNDVLKNFVMKLTDQIKTNLISQNTQNEIYEMRLGKIENYLNQVKEDTYSFVGKVEDRLINKMKDLKLYSELNIKKVYETLDRKINDFATNTDNNFNFISNQIIDTRIKTNENFEIIQAENKKRHEAFVDDLVEMSNRIYLYENILKEHDEENRKIKEQLATNISTLQSSFDVHTVNERIVHSIENQLILDEINAIKSGMISNTSNIADNMSEMNKNAQTNFNNLVERINYLQEMLTTVAEKNLSMIEDLQKNGDRIEVKQIINEMLSRTESDMILDRIGELKNVDSEQGININNAILSINSNRGEINDIKSKLDLIGSTLNSSGADMNGIAEQIKWMKENEMKDGVMKVMDNILSNIDNEMSKDMVNAMSSDNETRLLQAIHTLESKFNTHVNMNESEFTKINDIISKIANSDGKPGSVDTSEMEIKCTLNQMLNNVEFSNIYSYLGGLGKGTVAPRTPPINNVSSSVENNNEDIKEIIDNKINNALEKIKNDNMNMWINAVELSQKANDPNEIRKIIKEIPPVVIPMSESLKRILDVDYTNNTTPKPIVPALDDELKKVKEGNTNNKEEEPNNNDEEKSPMNATGNKTNSKKTPSRKSKEPSNEATPNSQQSGKSKEKELGGNLKRNPNNSNKDTSKIK